MVLNVFNNSSLYYPEFWLKVESSIKFVQTVDWYFLQDVIFSLQIGLGLLWSYVFVVK